jgi:hypothetical protein
MDLAGHPPNANASYILFFMYGFFFYFCLAREWQIKRCRSSHWSNILLQYLFITKVFGLLRMELLNEEGSAVVRITVLKSTSAHLLPFGFLQTRSPVFRNSKKVVVSSSAIYCPTSHASVFHPTYPGVNFFFSFL